MLSKKTRYALNALIRLATDYEKGAVQISDIAHSERIPQRFLENIIQFLPDHYRNHQALTLQ